MYVKDFMTKDLVTCPQAQSIEKTCQMFSTLGISAMWVEDETDMSSLLGVVTKSDVIRAYVQGLNVLDPISSIMKKEIQYVDEMYTRDQCADVMKRKHTHHLLVKNQKDEIIGMASTMDICRDIATITKECPFIRDHHRSNNGNKAFEAEIRKDLDHIVKDYQYPLQ